MSREVGRPSLLDEEKLQKAKDYLLGGMKKLETLCLALLGFVVI